MASLNQPARTAAMIQTVTPQPGTQEGTSVTMRTADGQQHLAAVLATMNLLAFAMHTVADLADQAWRAARAAVGARKRFFEDLRAITTYLVFPTWAALVETLRTGQPPPAVRDG